MKNSLERDIFKSDDIVEKCQDYVYAYKLYAALCNNTFKKGNDYWLCSWRNAGDLLARVRMTGSYMDFYCNMSTETDDIMEGFVTDEIRNDIESLGWKIIKKEDDNNDVSK